MNCTFLPGSSERDAEIHPRVLEEQDRGSELFFFTCTQSTDNCSNYF